jgi:GT2 family glycosyltransferase
MYTAPVIPKIALAVPCGGSVKMETVISIIETVRNSGYRTGAVITKGSIKIENRRKLVLEVKKTDFTHIFFLDSDMQLEPGTLGRLLKHQKQIIGITANAKRLPLESVVKLLGEDGNMVGGELPKELFQCYAVGTGCMLIDMEVFNIIDKPWFQFDYNSDGSIIGEDVWFCNQAKKKGIEIWCDPTIKIGHVGDYVY